MGVGYTASPLHFAGTVVLPGPAHLARPGETFLYDLLMARGGRVIVHTGPFQTRDPPIAVILAWRRRIAAKYRGQLGEDLSWDEDTAFNQPEDISSSHNLMLHYVAAVLDQQGEAAARSLAMQPKPPPEDTSPVFAEATRRSFGGRFPQLLLGATYWFPFKRHLIIEEPNWDGAVARYGSLPRLIEEVDAVRAVLAAAGPQAIAPEPDPARETIFAAAWAASETVARISAAAVAHDVPLWTSG